MSMRGAGAAEALRSPRGQDVAIGGKKKTATVGTKMPSLNQPAVSVIIPSYNSRDTIAECLRSLQNQTDAGVFEVIVVDSSTDGTAELVAQQFPEVKLFTSSERKFPGDARNIGIALARGDILAFTDADCRAAPNWIQEITAAHERLDPVIGGAVANGNPQSYVGWAYYFCEFSKWLPGAPAQRMLEIPTCCLSIKRWAFDEHGPFLEGTYCSDSAFQWKVAEAGHPPLFLPSAQVRHTNVSRLGKFLIHEMFHGQAFARVRVLERKLSWHRRLALALLSPLLPLVLIARIARRVLTGRAFRREFLLASPLVFAGLTMWSFGEFLGYLRGTAAGNRRPS